MLSLSNPTLDTTIKNLLKNSYSINSQYQIIGQWNYNSIVEIEDFGNYDQISLSNLYQLNTNYSSANHKIFYDSVAEDETITEEEYDNTKINKYYNLESCFENFRPTAGVVRPMALGNNTPMFYLLNINDIDKNNISINKPYPGSFAQDYTYWTSARFGTTSEGFLGVSGSTPSFENKYNIVVNSVGKGKIAPFVKYTSPVYVNTIRLVYQTHLGVPSQFKIEYLNDSNTWINMFDVLPDTRSLEKNTKGVFEIYYDYSNDEWKLLNQEFTPMPVTDLSVGSQQAIKINGLRLVVEAMSEPNIPFEMIELSPRLTVDLTDYTIGASFKTEVPDNSVGLPVGGITIGSGTISLSNDTNYFLNSNVNSFLQNSMYKNVKIKLFQVLSSESNSFSIPLKEMYVESWKDNDNFIVEAELQDFMKILQGRKANDIFIANTNVPATFAIQTMLHNLGYTNFKVLSSTKNIDTVNYFFAQKEKTVAEVLDDIAKATQSGIFIDAEGNLTYASREYMMNPQAPESWWLTSENIKINSGVPNMVEDNTSPYSDTYSVLDIDYLANIVTLTSETSDVINDGEIAYKSRSFKTYEALPNELFSKAVKKDTGLNSFGFQSKPSIKQIWSPGDKSSQGEDSNNNDVVLVGSLLKDTLKSSRLIDTTVTILKSEVASNPFSRLEDLLTNKILTDNLIDNNIKFITLSNLDVYTFPYEGYLRIDNEYINFKGKEYSKISSNKIGYDINKYSRTSNVITLNTVELHEFNINDSITISNTTDINGIYTITATPDDYTVRFASPGSNISEKYAPDGAMIISNLVPEKYITYSEIDKINNEEFSSIGEVSLTTGRVGLKLQFEEVSSDATSITYKIVSDGRGRFGTNVFDHIGLASESPIPVGWDKTCFHMYNEEIIAPDSAGVLVSSGAHQINRSNSQYVLDGIGSITEGAILISGSKHNLELDVQDFFDSIIEADSTGFNALLIKSLNLVYPGDSLIQGIYRNLNHVYNSFSTRLAHVQTKARSSTEEPTSQTPVAGLGIHVNPNNGTGYFLEVGASGGKELIANNLRFYKTYLSSNKLKAEVLFVGTVENVNQSILTTFGDLSTEEGQDAWTNLKINVENNDTFEIVVQGYSITKVKDTNPLLKTNNVMLFVRGDGSTLFDNVAAVASPNNTFLSLPSYGKFDIYNQGLEDYPAIENSESRFYESFGKDVNELKLYDFKYSGRPILRSVVADLSQIGAGYSIEEFNSNSFGGRLKLRNKTGRTLVLSNGTKNQLGIYGVVMKEDKARMITASGLLQDQNVTNKIVNSISQSRRKHGIKTFNLSSDYIQTYSQASKLMEWVLSKCSQEYQVVKVSIFANPFIEIGDFIKIYSPKHNIPNNIFIVTSIDYEISENGPKMSLELKEVR